jgi:hypothetical protein
LHKKAIKYSDAEVLYIVRSSFCPSESISVGRDERDGPLFICSLYNDEMSEMMKYVYNVGLLGMPKSQELASCWAQFVKISVDPNDETSCWALERKILGKEPAGNRPSGFSPVVFFP